MLVLAEKTGKSRCEPSERDSPKKKLPPFRKPKQPWKRNDTTQKVDRKRECDLDKPDRRCEYQETFTERNEPTDGEYEFLPDETMRMTEGQSSERRRNDSDCHLAGDRYKFGDVLRELYSVDQDRAQQHVTKVHTRDSVDMFPFSSIYSCRCLISQYNLV